jgi:hypothetical protein
MNDVLRRETQHWGNWPVYFGRANMTDNHHNQWIGRNLTCHGHATPGLGVVDYARLLNSTDQAFASEFPSTKNEISYSGFHSPLESVCAQLMAGVAQTSSPKGHGR